MEYFSIRTTLKLIHAPLFVSVGDERIGLSRISVVRSVVDNTQATQQRTVINRVPKTQHTTEMQLRESAEIYSSTANRQRMIGKRGVTP